MTRADALGAPLMVSVGPGSGGGARHPRQGASAYVGGQNAYQASWQHGGPVGACGQTLRARGAMGGGGWRDISMGDVIKVQGASAPGGAARPAGFCAPKTVKNRRNRGFGEDVVFARALRGGSGMFRARNVAEGLSGAA